MQNHVGGSGRQNGSQFVLPQESAEHDQHVIEEHQEDVGKQHGMRNYLPKEQQKRPRPWDATQKQNAIGKEGRQREAKAGNGWQQVTTGGHRGNGKTGRNGKQWEATGGNRRQQGAGRSTGKH